MNANGSSKHDSEKRKKIQKTRAINLSNDWLCCANYNVKPMIDFPHLLNCRTK